MVFKDGFLEDLKNDSEDLKSFSPSAQLYDGR